jgi:hypothetical protein
MSKKKFHSNSHYHFYFVIVNIFSKHLDIPLKNNRLGEIVECTM